MKISFRTRRISRILVLISILFTPLVFFSLSGRPWETEKFTSTLWQEAIYPFEYVWEFSSRTISNVWTDYFFLSGAAKENRRLKTEISLLKAKQMDYDEQIHEITRLRALVGFTKKYDRKLIVAEVVGRPLKAAFRSIRISRGSLDGIKIGMPVVSADGVVGKIIRVGLKYSDAQLLVDSNFNVDVLLQRTRIRGVLKGVAGEKCSLQLHRRTEVRIGDTIITSGIVGGFPKGLPVGSVRKIIYESNNVYQLITIEPWIDYQRLEEVMILDHPDPELNKISETAGDSWLENAASGHGGANGG